MSQLEPTFGAEETRPAKTSGFAIGSVICSLICCIPVTTILGVLLGVVGLLSINAKPTLRKGKGLAITGIVLGVMFTVAQVALLPVAKRGWDFMMGYAEFVQEGPSAALTAGASGDFAAFRDAFVGTGATLTDAEAMAFFDAMSDRYGNFVSVHLNEQAGTSQPQFGQPSAPFPYVITFDTGPVDGEAVLVFADQSTGQFLKKLDSIVIFDDQLGDLSYPPAGAP